MVDFESDIKQCIRVLETGGVILYPTDTIWGLGCDATDEQAVDKVFSIKRRPKEKSLIILLADLRDILQYVAAPPPNIFEIIESFTEPTTIIYPGALHLADNAVNEDGSVAIRVTTDPFCKALIKRFRKPLISTSANISGEPSAPVFRQVSPAIIQGVDYSVQYRQDDDTIKAPSRLVKINEEDSLTYLR